MKQEHLANLVKLEQHQMEGTSPPVELLLDIYKLMPKIGQEFKLFAVRVGPPPTYMHDPYSGATASYRDYHNQAVEHIPPEWEFVSKESTSERTNTCTIPCKRYIICEP